MSVTTEDILNGNYDYWEDEYSDYPVEDWVAEVNNGDTRVGYWEWVFTLITEDDNDCFGGS